MSRDAGIIKQAKKPELETELGVRVYGVSNGNGSLHRVAAGISHGLTKLGALRGFVPTDGHDPDAHFPGAFAEVAIHEGHPATVQMMHSHGYHERCYVMLAPNSTWVPDALIEMLTKKAKLVSPSHWGADILRQYTDSDDIVCVYQHGVSPAFQPSLPLHKQMVDAYHDGEFHVLHLSSSDRQRKGTAELVTAWGELMRQKALGDKPQLVVIYAGRLDDVTEMVYESMASEHHPTVAVRSPLNLDEDEMAALLNRFHIVCQPSRAEGFGLVPLEARACGVPIVATNCTGHADYVDAADAGVVVVTSGALAPSDDGPGALAPAVDADDVAASLAAAYQRWEPLHRAALQYADTVSRQWSWEAVTKRWLEEEKIEWT